MKNLQTFEDFLNESKLEEGLSTTTFNMEIVDKIWTVIKTLCESGKENVPFEDLSLVKHMHSKSEKWDFVAKNSDKLQIGQITATTFSLLVMIVENRTVKGYFEISPFDTIKQKFKPGTVYISVVTDDDLSNPRVRNHKKAVYRSLN